MSALQHNTGLQLPSSLQTQLHDFRRRVWTIKSIEAVCGALFGIVVAFLLLFALDRVVDTPTWARLALFAVAACGCAMLPVYFHRWIWRQRQFEQLARLLSRRHPSIGDQLLGVIDLVRNDFEQARSRALCEAAIAQVAEAAGRRDFRDSVPHPRHRRWLFAAAIPTLAALVVLALYPAAALNAWSRLIAPWKPVPRYTFTAIESLPERIVVPHGEPVSLSVRLLHNSRWQPATGSGQLGQSTVAANLTDGRYEFALPPQIDSASLRLAIGDARQHSRVEPMLRPALSSVVADVRLPDYLQRAQPLQKDVRGGTITLVNGSTATFTATADRNLASAVVDGQFVPIVGPTAKTAPMKVAASRKLDMQWQDEFGLAGQEPFTVSITARDDESPTLACEDLPRQKIVIDSETVSFKIRAQDDFGVKTVGIEWQGTEDTADSVRAKGEQLLASGGSDKETLELAGTFCAQTLGIEPQPLTVRLYAEDYLPGRGRIYSPSYTLYVLSAEQHAIWLTEQLSKWHRQSLEVRDREMQLHHANQQLRMLSGQELDRPEARRQLESQSAAERNNGRRLAGLVTGGEELVRQAMRNPEFGVGHLETWAQMLQILKDISGNRMPNVADLLKQSAQSPGALASVESNKAPMAGQARSGAEGTKQSESKAQPRPAVPQVVDAESSHGVKPKEGDPGESKKNSSSPRLSLPVTTVAGAGSDKKQQPPAAQKLDEAVKAQQDLLAEFDKIAEELNKVLANLEGSTLVKRLKAASRKQYVFAGQIGEQVTGTFGRRGRTNGVEANSLSKISQQELRSSQDMSTIMDDMQSYFERRRFLRFKTVLDEMRSQDAVGSLRQLSDDLGVETGMSIAQCEFWSDTFDRWADDLVDPACSGQCPGGKSKASLPPSVVLEAMQILEAEVGLREETRVAEQARAGLKSEEYGQRAGKLHDSQDGLSDRVSKLTTRIRELPDGEAEFAKEIALLGQVELVMKEASGILARPETGPAAIGAETEAIELLLQSKRINPKGGGGGGATPGGGGGGTTSDSALALIGTGVNEKEVREDRGISQTTGESGGGLPEEFRAGLDEYFNRLEQAGSTQ